jgi:C-terminal processing protease CtpA/Prc
MIQTFMKNSKGKYKKLIIDIRGNGGGDPKYWMKVLIEPLVKRTTYYECYAAVRKEFLRKQGILFEIYRWAQGGLFNKENYNFYDAEKSEYNSANNKSLQAYKVTKKFEPTNSFPFKGEVYLLVDRDCFSAAEDFASAVKGMKLATLIGANTQGGAAALLPPYIFSLPESGVMFAMETEITYTSDGQIDEIYGTAPDIELEGSTYPTTYPLSADKEEILKDIWIQQVLND